MLLKNLNIIGHDGIQHISITRDKIRAISPDESSLSAGKNELSVAFENAIAFPGLINSHDHLDFNLFPQTGNRIYRNYKEWGADIQTNNRKGIDAILTIPKNLRVQWGIYKNLLNGITTVVNHGEYLNIENPVIDIFQNCRSLHSVQERSWKFKLNRPFVKDQPFVIHIGEGTDASSVEEINELIRWNLFKRKIIAVHGVAMNANQAKAFEALVWCPDSNFFLLNETAKVNELKKQTKIIFGTDSTVSANWNMWEQIRLAKKTGMLSENELYESLTSLPAAVWGFDNRGSLAKGKCADIVIAKQVNGIDSTNNFFQINPEDILMVIRNGEILLSDEDVFTQCRRDGNEFCKIFINGTGKYVKGNLPGLIEQIKKCGLEINLPIKIK